MPAMRVHELARELGLSSKALLEMLAGMKVAAKSHSSSLDEGTVERVRRHVKGKSLPEAPARPAPARVAKTPTGERILGMRKITPPPAPPAPVEEPLAVAAPEVAAAATPVQEATPERVAPAASVRIEPEVPPRPPARTTPPVVPRVTPKEVKPARGMPLPGPAVKPVPARKEAPPRGPIPPAMRPPAEVPPPPAQPIAAAPPPSPVPAPPMEVPRRIRERIPPPPPPAPPAAPHVVPAEIELSGPLTVGELAGRLELAAGEVVKRLLEQRVLAGINQQISQDVAVKVAQSFGSSIRKPLAATAARHAPKRLEVERDAASVPRSPVVTILGHVDHGKTTLLDAIRRTNVAEREFGGITQHIGASTVEVDGRRIVFIDTPGHEAFTTLRARGAQVTDIAVLVVAADDGVMPQTVEAINHAKAAGVPIIVAINKVDLPQVNPDRVKQQLSELGLTPEDWGGDTVAVPVSARTKQGINELLEMILLVAELQELRANPARPGRGTIVEAKLDRGRGPVATVLVQEGMIRVGDAIVAGDAYGRVRAMTNDRGERLTEAPPATPAEVVGLDGVPQAGELLEVVRDERLAKAMAEERRERRRAVEVTGVRPGTVEEIAAQAGGPKELRLVLKADTYGSLEALTASLGRLSTAEVGITVLHAGVGNVAESDVMLAAASRAVVIGFNVRPEPQVRRLAEQEHAEILSYRVIYEAIDDIRNRLRGLLAPKRREVSLGQAEVRQTFTISKVGTIAGCYLTTGAIPRGASIRVIRDGVVVHEGKIASLRRFKDDVREVTEGFECGIGLERFSDIKVGDLLEAFEIREEPA